MTEHDLDIADVGAVIEHLGRHGVPEEVAGTGLRDTGSLDVSPHEVGEVRKPDDLTTETGED